jgi:hypothetical protein
VAEIKTHANIKIHTYKPTMTAIEIGKHQPRNINRGSERDKNRVREKKIYTNI